MSLEKAAKELERLELQMQKRAGSNGGGDKSNILAREEREKWGKEGKNAVQVAATSGEDKSFGNSHGHGHGEESKHGDGVGRLDRRQSVTIEGRKGFIITEADEKGARGKEVGRPQHIPSPTQTHLHRTGDIDVERGGHLEPSYRSRSLNKAGLAASRAGSSGTGLFHWSQFEAAEEMGIDARRWARDAPWRVPATLDRDGVERSLFGGDSLSSSAVGERDGGDTRGVPKEWRTEADVDLSDIKATMRRIDGVGAGSSVVGYTSNAFDFDARTSTSAFASAKASAAAAIRPVNSATAPAAMSVDREAFRHAAVSRAYDAYDGRVGASLLSSSISGGDRAERMGSDRISGWGVSSGSKAVLSALRALQDKIRKLESERDHASIEAGNLRRQIDTLQSNHERSAQVSEAQTQEKTLASRLAYERLQADKVAADIRLRKVEEHKRLLVSEAEGAKERAATAEAARQTAESRVRTLEDRLLGLGRQEEKSSVAEASAKEDAAERTREKADRIESLQSKVARMEASVTAEKALREEAEDGLARVLAEKGKLERFLEGVLMVNEELVKGARGYSGGGGNAKCKKTKRPKASTGAGGGGCIGDDFNVGTHTAKRASVRAKKVKQTKRSVVAPAAFTGDLSYPPARGVLGHALVHVPARQRKSACKALKKGSVRTGGPGKERAIPFVATGRGTESYNVVSAVSKAIRAARRGRPRESLDALYAEIRNAAVDNTKDVAFMFGGNTGADGTTCRQRQARYPRKAAVAGRSGRAVLDVAMPDLRGLRLDVASLPDRHDLEGDVDTSDSKQQWRQVWRHAVGLNDAAPPNRKEGRRQGARGGGREHSGGHTEDGKAKELRREYEVPSDQSYEEGAERDGEEGQDIEEEAACFVGRDKTESGRGLSVTDAGISSEDEREDFWRTDSSHP